MNLIKYPKCRFVLSVMSHAAENYEKMFTWEDFAEIYPVFSNPWEFEISKLEAERKNRSVFTSVRSWLKSAIKKDYSGYKVDDFLFDAKDLSEMIDKFIIQIDRQSFGEQRSLTDGEVFISVMSQFKMVSKDKDYLKPNLS